MSEGWRPQHGRRAPQHHNAPPTPNHHGFRQLLRCLCVVAVSKFEAGCVPDCAKVTVDCVCAALRCVVRVEARPQKKIGDDEKIRTRMCRWLIPFLSAFATRKDSKIPQRKIKIPRFKIRLGRLKIEEIEL